MDSSSPLLHATAYLGSETTGPNAHDDFADHFAENIWPGLEESYAELAKNAAEACRQGLAAKEITCEVTCRAKSKQSIAASIKRRRKGDKEQRWETLDNVTSQLHDLAGVRIIVRFGGDKTDKEKLELETVNNFVTSNFAVSESIRYEAQQKPNQLWQKRHGAFQCTNHRVRIRANDKIDDYLYKNAPKLKGKGDILLEIQVASFEEHMYNLLAHDLLYKEYAQLTRDEQALVDLGHGVAQLFGTILICLQPKFATADQAMQPIQRAVRKALTKHSPSEAVNELSTAIREHEAENKLQPVQRDHMEDEIVRQIDCRQFDGVDCWNELMYSPPHLPNRLVVYMLTTPKGK